MGKGKLKNIDKKRVGIMSKDGKEVIYLKSREEIDLNKYKLDQHHVDNMIKSGCLIMLGGDVKKAEVRTSTGATSSKSEVDKEKPKETEKIETDTKKSNH